MYKRTPIRILIAEDHALVRMALVRLLSLTSGIVCVGQAADGQQAVQLCDKLLPDIVLMDAAMPRLDGLTATQEIRRAHSEVRVVMLTISDDPAMTEAARRSGVFAVLHKPITIEALAQAIARAAA
jgi:DNA-binding NarL/FixJ family response regulator